MSKLIIFQPTFKQPEPDQDPGGAAGRGAEEECAAGLRAEGGQSEAVKPGNGDSLGVMLILLTIVQMVASIAAVHDTSESQKQLQTLQEENFLLKQQLSKSMTSMISTGKVSVTSAEKGDTVLVIWSEEHSNYQIYHEV